MTVSTRMTWVASAMESFGINPFEEGADFFRFVLELGLYRVENPGETVGSGKILARIAKQTGVYYLALLSRMRRVVRPMLQASADELRAVHMNVDEARENPEERTVYTLAWSLAGFFLE